MNNTEMTGLGKEVLVTEYIKENKLPEVEEYKLGDIEKVGYVVEYLNGGITQLDSINGFVVIPTDPPVAITYFGEREDEEEAATFVA